MEVPPLLLQTAGSLVAILALGGLARWLRLGSLPRLASDDDVGRAAGEVDDGFDPVAIARDAEGRAAIARDAQGQIMVIKRHGNRFAGRMLTPAAKARLWTDFAHPTLEVDCGELWFRPVYLDVPDPGAWAAAINALKERHHA